MDNRPEYDDHTALDLLLPWYVNGTLDGTEHAMIERHVAECSECSKNVAVLRRMQATVNDDVTIPMVPGGRFDEVLEVIERQDAEPAPTAWLTPRSIAAGVAVALIAALALFAGLGRAPDSIPVFETATTADASTATNYVLAIEFESDTTADRRAAIIAAIGGTELGASDQPHTLRVAVPVTAATLEELAAFTEEVAANAAVVRVRVVAVQLPIE